MIKPYTVQLLALHLESGGAARVHKRITAAAAWHTRTAQRKAVLMGVGAH